MSDSVRKCSSQIVMLSGRGAAIVAAFFASTALAQVAPQDMIDWGLEVFAETSETLQRSGSVLFAETASLNGNQYGGSSGFAYVWPLSTQFRVQNSLVRADPETYAPSLRVFSDEARSRYWKTVGGGYRSGVSSNSTRYDDDNAHIAVALMEAYRITADPIYLTRAEETYDFVISGEDAVGGGGIYFHESDQSTKETISTLQGARAALMLYQATEEPAYFMDATRLYDWARTHTQQPDGLFLEKYYLTGPNAGTAGNFALVNAAGDAMSVNLEFYAATGDTARLQEAQRIATRSLTRYFNRTTGAINDEGFWAFELVDALNDLHRVDGNPVWLENVVDALEWLHINRRDPNGHYGRLWGRGGFQASPLPEWHLNDQASVARSYLHTGLTMLAAAPIAGDYNRDGVVDAADYVVWRNDLAPAGDYETWRAHFGTTAASSTFPLSVPEPRAWILMVCALVQSLRFRKRP
jgi:Glycosyl hydrolase family 76